MGMFWRHTTWNINIALCFTSLSIFSKNIIMHENNSTPVTNKKNFQGHLIISSYRKTIVVQFHVFCIKTYLLNCIIIN